MSSKSPTERAAPAAKRPRWRVLLTRAAFVCAVLLTALVALNLVENARGRAAWQKYQAEARARQVKLNLMEYVAEPVADERNFAAVPIFQDTFRIKPPPDPFALPGNSTAPPLGNVAKNELPDLAAWQKYFVTTHLLSAAGDNPAADVLKALEQYAAPWEELRTAAARPGSRFPVRYEDGVAAALPHIQVLRSAVRLNTLRLLAHLDLGDSAAAYEDFRLGVRLYEALEKEPALVVALVRLASLSSVENAVWAGLVRRQWAAPELEKMAGALARLRLMDDYLLGLNTERGFNNMIHEQLVRNGSRDLAILVRMVNEGERPGNWASSLSSLYPSGWLRLNQTRSNRYFDEMVARVAQDPPRIFSDRPVTALPADMRSVGTVERARYMLFLILAPALSEVERNYGHGQTLLDQTRLACALERHRLAQGGFPASLDPLVPAFIPALPADVMNGQPLHYRPTADDGYVLYSVAMNLKDDGGKSDPKASAKLQADWVWSVPGK